MGPHDPPRSPFETTQSAFFAIADISGYTGFLAHNELAHAQGILAEITQLEGRSVLGAQLLAVTIHTGEVQQHRELGGAFDQSAVGELPQPTMRLPSQCPGTARPAASGGRSLIMTPGVTNFLLRLRVRARRTRREPRSTAREAGQGERSPGILAEVYGRFPADSTRLTFLPRVRRTARTSLRRLRR
jgi:hypothetical protein